MKNLSCRMKTLNLTLILILLLSVTTFAQELIDPVRISFAEDSKETQTDLEFNECLRRELGKLRYVAFTSSHFDCKVLTASTPITEHGRLIGYSVAVAILIQKEDKISLVLHIETGPTLDRLALEVAAYLDRGFFSHRRSYVNSTSSK